MEQSFKGKLCTVILASDYPQRHVRVTAEEARRLLIWLGRRRIGEPATAEYTLSLAFPIDDQYFLQLTSPRDVLRLDRRSGNRRIYDVDRRDQLNDRALKGNPASQAANASTLDR